MKFEGQGHSRLKLTPTVTAGMTDHSWKNRPPLKTVV